MSESTYNNPTSIRPEYGWKPQGFLAGMNYASDRQRYEDTASLQDYMMKNQAIESGAKLSDYFSDAPVRDAKRASDIATSNATTSTIGGIKQNELVKGSQENELNAKTMGSKIAEAAAKAAMEGDKSQMSHLATGAAIGRALGAAAGNGPGALAGVMQQLQSSGADPRIIEWFKNSRSPQELMQKAKLMTDAFMQANEHYRSTMDANAASNASHEKVAGINASAALAVAQERSKSKNKDVEQMMNEIAKRPVDQQIPFYERVIADPDVSEKIKDQAQSALKAAIKIKNMNAKTDPQAILGSDGKPIIPADKPRTYGGDAGPGSGIPAGDYVYNPKTGKMEKQ